RPGPDPGSDRPGWFRGLLRGTRRGRRPEPEAGAGDEVRGDLLIGLGRGAGILAFAGSTRTIYSFIIHLYFSLISLLRKPQSYPPPQDASAPDAYATRARPSVSPSPSACSACRWRAGPLPACPESPRRLIGFVELARAAG